MTTQYTSTMIHLPCKDCMVVKVWKGEYEETLSRSKSSKDPINEGSRQIHPYQKIYLDQNKLNHNLTSCLTRQCGLILITRRILLFPHWCSIFSDRNGSLSLVMFNSFTWVMGWDVWTIYLQHWHCASKKLLVDSDGPHTRCLDHYDFNSTVF